MAFTYETFIAIIILIFIYIVISSILLGISKFLKFKKNDFKSSAICILLSFGLPTIAFSTIYIYSTTFFQFLLIIGGIIIAYLFYKKSLTKKIPVGFLFIIALGIGVIIDSISYLLAPSPLMEIGFTIVQGILASFLYLIVIVINLIIIYGVIKKVWWSWLLIIVYCSISIILPIVRQIMYSYNEAMYNQYYNISFIAEESILGTPNLSSYFLNELIVYGLISLIIIIYVVKNKKYFPK